MPGKEAISLCHHKSAPMKGKSTFTKEEAKQIVTLIKEKLNRVS
jgi:hypothetical protein